MNALRRVLLAVYSVLLVAACVGLAVLAWNQDQQLDIDLEQFRLTAAIVSGDTEKWIFTLLLLSIALFGVLTFVLALVRGGRESGGTLRLRQAEGGTVEVTAETLEELLRDELERLPEIRQADPEVRLVRDAVSTHITTVIEPSVSIAHATNLVAVTTASALREQVGVTNVRRPDVRILYDEANARPMPARSRPTGPIYPPPSREEPWPEPPADLHQAEKEEDQPETDPWPEPPADLRPAEGSQPAREEQEEGAQKHRD